MNPLFARVIVTCALSSSGQGAPEHVESLLYRIASVNTRDALHAHTVIDATLGRRHEATSVSEAAGIARALVDAGHTVHLGPMGLPPQTRARYRLSVEQSLDVCKAVGVASLELERLVTPSIASRDELLHIALSAYWSPDDPDDLQAIEWGARVLATPTADVAHLARQAPAGTTPQRRDRVPRRRVFFEPGVPTPRKWRRP